MIERGQVRWNDFGPPVGSRPAKRRPVVVVSSDRFNASGLATAIVAAITSNLASARRPGNVFVPGGTGGLRRDSVVNITSVAAINKFELDEPMGTLPADLMAQVDAGLRLVLGL